LSNKVYVANISYEAKEHDLEELFSTVGTVRSVKLIYLSDGRHKGFGFIELDTKEEAQNAVDELNGAEFFKRDLKVDIARERTYKPRNDDYQRNRYGGY
jgi:RNA recognition motif-containing protein